MKLLRTGAFTLTCLMVVATPALVATAAPFAGAKARPKQTTTKSPATPAGRPFTARAVYDVTTVASPADKCEPVSGFCGRIGFVPLTVTGDIAGTGEYVSSVLLFPPSKGAYFSGSVIYDDVNVAGCGKGSFAAVFGATFTTPSTDGSYPARWEIVPDKGTGALTKLRGEGLLRGDFTNPAAVVGNLVGTLRC